MVVRSRVRQLIMTGRVSEAGQSAVSDQAMHLPCLCVPMLAPFCCAPSCMIAFGVLNMSTSLLGFCLVHLQACPARALCSKVKARAASCTSFSAIICLACVLSVSQHVLHIALHQSHGWRCTCRAGVEQALSRAPGFWRLLPRGARFGCLLLATVPADAGDDQVCMPACFLGVEGVF